MIINAFFFVLYFSSYYLDSIIGAFCKPPSKLYATNSISFSKSCNFVSSRNLPFLFNLISASAISTPNMKIEYTEIIIIMPLYYNNVV